MACPNNDGRVTNWAEETTDWIGNYAMRFEGTPDLSSCSVQVSPGGGQSLKGCGATTGPPKPLKLMFRMFDMAMYSVDPLISQPAEPMSFCPRSISPVKPPPSFPVPTPVVKPPPAVVKPPLPRSPPQSPVPFLEASACPHQ